MAPRVFPRAHLMVSLTGVVEILGAVGTINSNDRHDHGSVPSVAVDRAHSRECTLGS
jgi:hypothetical protein